jgi:hypothetical protein
MKYKAIDGTELDIEQKDVESLVGIIIGEEQACIITLWPMSYVVAKHPELIAADLGIDIGE